MIKQNNLTFSIDDDGGLTLVSCDLTATDVIIPAEVDGYPVAEIDEAAFKGCTELKTVKFPTSLALAEAGSYYFKIGDNAFEGCISLESVEIPDAVMSIGHGAFYGCRSLHSVTLPKCYVGPYAFAHCESLGLISNIATASEGVFSHCKSLKYLPISENAGTISESSFEHCDALRDVTVPEGIKRIEPLAFRGCKNLKTVTFKVKEGWYGGNSHTGATYPIDVTDPERNADRLKSMDFDEGQTAWKRD